MVIADPMHDFDTLLKDRRQHERTELEAPVTISWSERSGRYRREQAILRNCSRDGAELEFREAIEEGTRILTEDDDYQRWGDVRHTTQHPAGGYRIGLQFEYGGNDDLD